jgi:hypothetical protein
MSRLDQRYLRLRGLGTWKEAFAEASNAMDAPPSSFKNLRDEFDPLHGNKRRGWHQRPLRSNRQRVLADLCDVSDDALLELVDNILRGETESIAEAIDALATSPRIAQNVAERLLTGRLAEEYFLAHCEEIVGVRPTEILDLRQAATGYDFGIRCRPEIAIETKGLRATKGEILFTDREWAEAKRRGPSFWLVVVGGVRSQPCFRLFRDPYNLLDAKCRHQKTVVAFWHSCVSVQE